MRHIKRENGREPIAEINWMEDYLNSYEILYLLNKLFHLDLLKKVIKPYFKKKKKEA